MILERYIYDGWMRGTCPQTGNPLICRNPHGDPTAIAWMPPARNYPIASKCRLQCFPGYSSDSSCLLSLTDYTSVTVGLFTPSVVRNF